jgi:hypothetical protein
LEEALMVKSPSVGIVALASVVFSTASHAITTTYTTESSFLAALPGAASTLDFDSTASGTIINSGDSVGGITFTYSIGPPPINMAVVSDFETTSGTNYLGLDDPGNFNLFIAGDTFSLSFANPVNALGMYFVSGDPLFANDIELVTASGSAFNSDTVDVSFGDGGLAYYIGLISDTQFSSASIQFDPSAEGAFLYSVDDITTAVVPIPGAIWLFISGLLGFTGLRTKRKPS